MALLGKLFWIALTGVFTLCFVVLFEYGTVNYVDNFQREIQGVKELFTQTPHAKKDTSDKLK